MWDLSVLTRDQTSASVLGAQSLNHQTNKEVQAHHQLNVLKGDCWET